jgi:proteic killer suppression protein
MMMIGSFRSRGLAQLWASGKSRYIASELQARIIRRLDLLNAAHQPEAMNVPGFDFHALRGKPIRYTVHVNGPWCVTFGWDEQDAIDVDLEQYH